MRVWIVMGVVFAAVVGLLTVIGNTFTAVAASDVYSEIRRPRSVTVAETTPITNPQPTSMLLPYGTSAITLSVETPVDTTCAYSVDEDRDYGHMQRFSQSGVRKQHVTSVALDPDTNWVNQVFVRCASDPSYKVRLLYRSLPKVNPSYPRTGNLWGGKNFDDRTITDTARIDLWLGPDFSSDRIRQLRQANPNILILTSINAVEEWNLPDDYYLKDIHGNKVEIWPNFYRLNLTKPYVAEYQARSAAKRIIDSGLLVDGIFFDNVFTTQSWLSEDIYGNPFPVDADEDGKPDPSWELDAKWKEGVFAELKLFRKLMPNAIVNGHAMNINERGIGEIFNGISIGFEPANVREGEASFSSLFGTYQAWQSKAVTPNAIMFEASPPDLLAYGYGYTPWQDIPASTLDFARSYYPYMRFGLVLTLMGDGYFAYEFGDAWHGNDWWYDELDFDLGYPTEAAQRVKLSVDKPTVNLVDNGGFEQGFAGTWDMWANGDENCVADLVQDKSTAASGSASARMDITATSATDWHIEMRQWQRQLNSGANYVLAFYAKADRPRPITLQSRKGAADWELYGLNQTLQIDETWRPYTITFEANTSAADARLQFQVGALTGTVWLDDVRLYETTPNVYRRGFDNGLVLLNGSSQPVTFDLEPGYQRLKGTQAPRHEWMIDNDANFAVTGSATPQTYDSGEWHATPPFFHNWGSNAYLLQPGSSASWSIEIPETDRYTINAWWPAAPESSQWNPSALYEVVIDEDVVLSTTLDQRSGGDQWHRIAERTFSPGDHPTIRLRCPGSAPCLADAIYLRSDARYNDGSPVQAITLQPFDGIILQKERHQVLLPFMTR
ncbi:MAG: carbohydrate binding domain-containing protein [Caldilineaceae bacterium]